MQKVGTEIVAWWAHFGCRNRKSLSAACQMSCQLRERAPMIFNRSQAGSAGIRRFVPCGPLAHKRPNQDAALQILLKDPLYCRRGGGTHPAPLNSHRGRPNGLQAHPRWWDGAPCVWGPWRKNPCGVLFQTPIDKGTMFPTRILTGLNRATGSPEWPSENFPKRCRAPERRSKGQAMSARAGSVSVRQSSSPAWT